jgi:hypothetical protein
MSVDVYRGARDAYAAVSAGKLMVSSIAKSDLVKVLKRVAPGTMLPHTLLVLQEVCDEVG